VLKTVAVKKIIENNRQEAYVLKCRPPLKTLMTVNVERAKMKSEALLIKRKKVNSIKNLVNSLKITFKE